MSQYDSSMWEAEIEVIGRGGKIQGWETPARKALGNDACWGAMGRKDAI